MDSSYIIQNYANASFILLIIFLFSLGIYVLTIASLDKVLKYFYISNSLLLILGLNQGLIYLFNNSWGLNYFKALWFKTSSISFLQPNLFWGFLSSNRNIKFYVSSLKSILYFFRQGNITNPYYIFWNKAFLFA
jgi:hypothetical protein